MPNCEICGEPMPEGEEMFKYHGHSGPCSKPPLPREQTTTIILTKDAFDAPMNRDKPMTESEKRFKSLPWELRAYAERCVCKDWSKAPGDAMFKAQKLAFAVDDFVKSALKSINAPNG